ncbi:hypothetical protein M0R72_07520 [Candidatus Pacearchaeota archaeon]|nr:hypothetical protein [Candidatus Pacearchaeota archaeon]
MQIRNGIGHRVIRNDWSFVRHFKRNEIPVDYHENWALSQDAASLAVLDGLLVLKMPSDPTVRQAIGGQFLEFISIELLGKPAKLTKQTHAEVMLCHF